MPFSAKRRYKSKLIWGFAFGTKCQPYIACNDIAVLCLYGRWECEIIPSLQRSEFFNLLHKLDAKTKGQ